MIRTVVLLLLLALATIPPTQASDRATASAVAPTAAVPATGANVPHKIEVRDPATRAQVEAQGGRLVADYGEFQLYEVGSVSPALLTQGSATVRDDFNLLRLNAARLDTRLPAVKALQSPIASFQGKRLHLVQFAGPIQPAWRQQLLDEGVSVVSYIPENAYLVYGDAASLAKIHGLAAAAPHIQWDGAYQEDYRIHPLARRAGTEWFMIQLLEDAPANAATLGLINQMKLEPVRSQRRALHYVNIIVRLAPADLARVAAQPEVVSIHPYVTPKMLDERQDQIIAGALAGNAPTGPGYLNWLVSKGFTQAQFTASGFAVNVSDSGIDNGTATPSHFGLFVGGNPAGASRVLYNRLEGSPNKGSTLQGCDGHGNINSHIIGGYDDFVGFPFADDAGYHYGLGVCPWVNLGSSVIFDAFDYTFPDFANLESEAYQSGARVDNNSWGSSSDGVYDAQAQEYDALVRDAQPDGSSFSTPGNQEMVIVFAAGNATNAMSVGSPGSAKNVFTVGASQNVQPVGPPFSSDGCRLSDTQDGNANEIAFFSSRGPTADGRHKPDLVAPGTHISGGVPQAADPALTGTALPCFSNAVQVEVCGTIGSRYFPAGQQYYTISSGTSHSTPCVSGACALLRQYFINNSNTPPSPAMTKAYLMNTARYMTGASVADDLWSDNQGMGELNLGMALDGVPRILRDEMPADLFTSSGQARTFTGAVADPTQPFRVTVAWTDAPGSTTSVPYNNNLDLMVTVNGQTYLGNVFSGSLSVAGGAADSANNVESVFLPAGTTGKFTVKVVAANINSEGVPTAGHILNQDFALVIYNGLEVAPAGATLAAENFVPANHAPDPGETVTMNFALTNFGSAPVSNLVATLQAGGGLQSPSGPQNFGTLLPGGPAVSAPFTFVVTGPCGGTINPTFTLQTGSAILGTVGFSIPIGAATPYVVFSESFDGVTAPNLPAGWTTNNSGFTSGWVTSPQLSDLPPNSAFVRDSTTPGFKDLISPPLVIQSAKAQLSFLNNFNLECPIDSVTDAFDGGVLEIKIGGGPFTDILAAGGSFASGGYTRVVDPFDDNPLDGRQVWSGNSQGFIRTTVNLPAAAAGQIVQFNWRLGMDTANFDNSFTGWNIDSITVTDYFTICTPPSADLAVGLSASPNPATVRQNLTYTIAVTNLGPVDAAGVTLTDTLPATVSFVSASPGYTNLGGALAYSIATLSNGLATNFVITVLPLALGTITNAVSISASTADLFPANNAAVNLTSVQFTPIVTGIVLGSTNVAIQFLSIAGQQYALEYKNTLSDPSWTIIPHALTGTGGVLEFDTTNGLPASRFYRIVGH